MSTPLSDYVRDQVRDGLDREGSAPVGTGYVQALAGFTPTEGAFGRLEAGWHPRQNLTLYGEAEDSSRLGFNAGIGARWSFG